jgi:hypothetical protein
MRWRMASPKVGQIRPQTPPGIQESDGGTGHWLGRRDGIGINVLDDLLDEAFGRPPAHPVRELG